MSTATSLSEAMPNGGREGLGEVRGVGRAMSLAQQLDAEGLHLTGEDFGATAGAGAQDGRGCRVHDMQRDREG